jgi:hypothetical protein
MSTPVERLKKWFSSPLDRAGLLTWAAGLVQTAYTEYTSHTFVLATFLGWAVAGLVAVIVPDNSVLKSDVEQLVSAGVAAALGKNLAAGPAILADISKTVTDSGVKL